MSTHGTKAMMDRVQSSGVFMLASLAIRPLASMEIPKHHMPQNARWTAIAHRRRKRELATPRAHRSGSSQIGAYHRSFRDSDCITSHLSHPAPLAYGMNQRDHRGVGCRCLLSLPFLALINLEPLLILRRRIEHQIISDRLPSDRAGNAATPVIGRAAVWHRANKKKPASLSLPLRVVHATRVLLARYRDGYHFVGEVG